MHQSSYRHMEEFANIYLPKDRFIRILEIGSQDVNGTFKPIFTRPNWVYYGADMVAGKNVDIVLHDPYKWAIPDNAYDVIISGSCLEHIEFPWLTMCEVARIMKVGGLTCHIAPSAGFEHRFPVDCYRYYPDGFLALLKWAKLSPLYVATDWNPAPDADGGHIWHDTVMVARKEQ